MILLYPLCEGVGNDHFCRENTTQCRWATAFAAQHDWFRCECPIAQRVLKGWQDRAHCHCYCIIQTENTQKNISWICTFVLIISKESGKICQVSTKVFDYLSKLCCETITFCFPLHGAQLWIESQINTKEAHSGIFSLRRLKKKRKYSFILRRNHQGICK